MYIHTTSVIWFHCLTCNNNVEELLAAPLLEQYVAAVFFPACFYVLLKGLHPL